MIFIKDLFLLIIKSVGCIIGFLLGKLITDILFCVM